MTIEDPTLSTLASYDMSGGEAFMGSILLASTILLEMLNSMIPQVHKVYLNHINTCIRIPELRSLCYLNIPVQSGAVEKKFLEFKNNFCNSRLKAENLQRTRTIY